MANIYKYMLSLDLENEVERKAHEKLAKFDKIRFGNQKSFIIQLLLGAEEYIQAQEALQEQARNNAVADTSSTPTINMPIADNSKELEEIKRSNEELKKSNEELLSTINHLVSVISSSKTEIINEIHNIPSNNIGMMQGYGQPYPLNIPPQYYQAGFPQGMMPTTPSVQKVSEPEEPTTVDMAFLSNYDDEE